MPQGDSLGALRRSRDHERGDGSNETARENDLSPRCPYFLLLWRGSQTEWRPDLHTVSTCRRQQIRAVESWLLGVRSDATSMKAESLRACWPQSATLQQQSATSRDVQIRNFPSCFRYCTSKKGNPCLLRQRQEWSSWDAQDSMQILFACNCNLPQNTFEGGCCADSPCNPAPAETVSEANRHDIGKLLIHFQLSVREPRANIRLVLLCIRCSVQHSSSVTTTCAATSAALLLLLTSDRQLLLDDSVCWLESQG